LTSLGLKTSRSLPRSLQIWYEFRNQFFLLWICAEMTSNLYLLIGAISDIHMCVCVCAHAPTILEWPVTLLSTVFC
jgi:hypothetical protein